MLLDFHGESVFEKLSLAFAFDGLVSAFIGTHTHVQTNDLRILPNGTAYVSDVGMTGAGGGIQGYAPEGFVQRFRTQGFDKPHKQAALAKLNLARCCSSFRVLERLLRCCHTADK